MDSNYDWCALSYFYLKSAGQTDNQIRATLTDLFGEARALEVVNSLSDPSLAFAHLSLPECGNCDHCEIRGDCQYPSWQAVADRLREPLLASRMDQSSLQALFG